MQLIRARIQNFRSLRGVLVDFGAHTALIGGNGSGKSSLLKALEKFYLPARTLDPDDFYGRDQSQTVEIELTFGGLTEEEAETFESRVRDGHLTVTRVFDNTSSSGRYHGVVLSHPAFNAIRAISQALPRRTAYNELRLSDGLYTDLPVGTSAQQIDEAMRQWEADHPDALSLNRDEGQFFGFQNAGRGALERFTSFVFVPAVREASADAADAKSSPIGRLLELVVRSAILQREDVSKFREEVNEKYKELTSPENMPELGHLASRLTTDLKHLYSEATVGLSWRETAEMSIPLPNADVVLGDDGFGGPVDRQGHGLQRAFIFTLLQHLSRASRVEPDASEEEGQDAPQSASQAPALILAIEEPELYQHPTKQRHFSAVLRRLSAGALPGADGRTQVIFASHSPMFVSVPNVDEIRFVRRVDCEGQDYKECELRSLDLNSVAQKLEVASQAPLGSYSATTLAPRLHILGSELAEGFFADGIVLVEGPSDRAALYAAAERLGVDFESAGIAVLPVLGKNNLDRPLLIFRELGISTFPVWDCDRVEDAAQNLRILRAADPQANYTAAPLQTVVSDRYAHFAETLEKTLIAELGEEIFVTALATACAEFDAPLGRDAQKSPTIMGRLLGLAEAQGATSPTLEALIEMIWLQLRGAPLSGSATATETGSAQ